MCKILLLTNTEKIKNQKFITETIARHLINDHKDGFGYAIHGTKGIFGERSIKPNFESLFPVPETLKVSEPIFKPMANTFGTLSKGQGGAIFHGRTSTNDHGLANAHPIIKNNWTLIHNGVVTNHGEKYEKITTNDTEDLVHYLSTTGIEGIEQNITGYYAFGAFDPQGNLHIVRDSIAQLYVAINKTLNCSIFGTTEKLITDVAQSCHWKIGPIEAVKNDIHLIYNPQGVLIHNKDIVSRGYGQSESQWANQSLGYELDIDYKKPIIYDYESHEEINESDLKGYTFFDWEGNPLTYKQFMMLDEVTKQDCFVYRPDNTIVDRNDYYIEKIS